MADLNPDERVLQRLGSAVARARLDRNWTQDELAHAAGISRPTVSRLENGQSTQLSNLVRVLRALELLDRLDLLVPDPHMRPLERLAEQQGRAPRRRARSGTGDDAEQPWTWGEDA